LEKQKPKKNKSLGESGPPTADSAAIFFKNGSRLKQGKWGILTVPEQKEVFRHGERRI